MVAPMDVILVVEKVVHLVEWTVASMVVKWVVV